MLKMAPLDCAINELWQCWRRTGHLPSFSSSPQGIDSARVPTPQNLPSKAKQMLMPGGQPGGGEGAGRAWGGELIVFVGSGVGHLTFVWSCSPRCGDIWIFLCPTWRYLTADSDEKDWDRTYVSQFHASCMRRTVWKDVEIMEANENKRKLGGFHCFVFKFRLF